MNLQPITKDQFYAQGGANNPQLIRKPAPNGQWAYYIDPQRGTRRHANWAH